MTNYRDIFLKYGLVPPKKFYVPNKKEIIEKAETIAYYNTPTLKPEVIYFATLFLSTPENHSSFRISNHENFISSFKVDIDLSKFHPDLFLEMDLNINLIIDSNALKLLYPHFIEGYKDTEIDKYLTHFSPGYPLRKAFSEDARSKEIDLFNDYVSLVISPLIQEVELTEFLAEVYQFICSEQDKKY